MVWGVIRVAIFTGSFLLGLMFSNSGASSAASKIDAVHAGRSAAEVQCRDRHVVLVDGGEKVVPKVHSVGM